MGLNHNHAGHGVLVSFWKQDINASHHRDVYMINLYVGTWEGRGIRSR